MAKDPLPRAVPEDVGMSSERLALLGRFVEAEVSGGRLPGAVVAVARRGKLVALDAYGHRDKAIGARMAVDSIFSVASMTKPMVAVAALQLLEYGLLHMDQPLSTWFPRFADARVAVMDDSKETIVATVPARPIAIQDLLRHTSGLSYGRSGTTVAHKAFPLSSEAASREHDGDALLRLLASLPLPHQPGTIWEYGFGLDVLGLVIEKVTDQPLGLYLWENLWRPLGLDDTSFVLLEDKLRRHAKALQPELIPSPTQPRKFESGGMGMFSTAGDYLRFAQMLLDGGTLDGARILGRKTVEYMLADHLGSAIENRVGGGSIVHADHGFGLGVAVRTTPGVVRTLGSVGEFSWPGAFGTYWWADPREELAAVWMACTPAPAQRAHYRYVVNSLVNQAIAD